METAFVRTTFECLVEGPVPRHVTVPFTTGGVRKLKQKTKQTTTTTTTVIKTRLTKKKKRLPIIKRYIKILLVKMTIFVILTNKILAEARKRRRYKYSVCIGGLK